jgi:hypothetical protein
MQNRTALVLATPAEGEELATEVPVELVRCPACHPAPPPPQRPGGRNREKSARWTREKSAGGANSAASATG